MDELASCYGSARTLEDPDLPSNTVSAARTQDIEVWKQVFQELIQEVKPWHKWTLEWDKDILPDSSKPGWVKWQQKAFARFQCSSCSRNWASGHIQVLFYMHWNKKKHQGQVKMRTFAQRCKKCPSSPFEVPEFTLENISRILNNLVLQILQKCYKEGFKPMEGVSVIKDTELEGPHDSTNCEACLQGFCAQSYGGLATQRPSSPHPCGETGVPSIIATGINIPQGDKVLPSRVNPKDPIHPKADPKIRHTSPTRQVLSTSTVDPKSQPPKTDPKSQPTSHTQQVLPTLVVNPKSKPPKSQPTSHTQHVQSTLTVDPKSQPPKTDPKSQPTSHTQQVLPTLVVNPKSKPPKSQPTSHTQHVQSTSTVDPKSQPPKTDPKSQPTSHTQHDLCTLVVNPKSKPPKSQPTSHTQHVQSTSTVDPKSQPPKTDPKSQPTSHTQQVLPTLVVNPKSKPPKSQPTSHTQHVQSTSTVNPKSSPPKIDPKSQPTSHTQHDLCTLMVNPKSNPPKTDPKVSHMSKPSTALTSLTFTVNPEVPIFSKADPKPQCTTKSSTTPTLPQGATTVSPQIPNPCKDDLIGHKISKSSTFPRLPPSCSPIPALATRMASPENISGGDRRSMLGRTQFPCSPIIEPVQDPRPSCSWNSTASTSHGIAATCVDIGSGCGECLCQCGECLYKALCSRCGFFILILVIIIVVVKFVGII
ncbi:receptor-transporting protein 3 [Dipodomys merriami]|uniref:receptor-transporting protein 3 n=1 Tax=Dipodomys merriami TaxID=94247 RepID=UPI003850A678